MSEDTKVVNNNNDNNLVLPRKGKRKNNIYKLGANCESVTKKRCHHNNIIIVKASDMIKVLCWYPLHIMPSNWVRLLRIVG